MKYSAKLVHIKCQKEKETGLLLYSSMDVIYHSFESNWKHHYPISVPGATEIVGQHSTGDELPNLVPCYLYSCINFQILSFHKIMAIKTPSIIKIMRYTSANCSRP